MAGAIAFRLTIDRAAAARVGGDAALRLVTDVTRRTLNQATIETPVDTGRLRAANQSHVLRSGTVVTGEVFNTTEYAKAVHDGTRAHTVRPVRKKALRFTVGGEVVFSRWARIPARKGRPWLLIALKKVAIPAGFKLTGA